LCSWQLRNRSPQMRSWRARPSSGEMRYCYHSSTTC
jgi:hypothetical protein